MLGRIGNTMGGTHVAHIVSPFCCGESAVIASTGQTSRTFGLEGVRVGFKHFFVIHSTPGPLKSCGLRSRRGGARRQVDSLAGRWHGSRDESCEVADTDDVDKCNTMKNTAIPWGRPVATFPCGLKSTQVPLRSAVPTQHLPDVGREP